ncbi:MAG: hypothetical protein ICV66_05070 [Chitinophagaceae bacterium]|nr:hypothetical protein [Chitinophagaceae bacterium]
MPIKFFTYLFILSSLSASSIKTVAQVILDSSGKKIETATIKDKKVDSVLKLHSPKTAAIRSAILPGLGQAYNKKYWKIPIVYAALGTAAGFFVYNLNWYKRFRYAYKALYNHDTANYQNVYPRLQPFIEFNDLSSLRYNRDEFRRNVDYSVLFFLLLWGLNVVDATVDAHLKSFDVSPDLSLKIRAGYNELAHNNGVGLVLTFK